MSDEIEHIEPNITVNVEDVPVAADEVAAEPEPEPEPEVAEDDFDEYLKSIELEKFINKFKENGYDSVESLKNINTSDIRKISKNLNQSRYINKKLKHFFN